MTAGATPFVTLSFMRTHRLQIGAQISASLCLLKSELAHCFTEYCPLDEYYLTSPFLGDAVIGNQVACAPISVVSL
jgi:hypothetical protein